MPKLKSRRIPHPIWLGVAAVLMVVLCVVVYVWLPYHREQVVIWKIERVGGNVKSELDGPFWFSKLVGKEEFSWIVRVKSVDLSETAASGEELKHLKDLFILRLIKAE